MISAIPFLLIAMISVQVGAGYAKSLFPLAGAAGTTTLRVFFAALILWIIFRPWRLRLDRSAFQKLWLYGFALGLMNLTFYIALERIPLGIAVTLEFIGPLALSIFSSRSRIDILWAFLAAVGIFLVMPHSDLESSLDLLGVVFALIAGGFWAAYIYYGQKAGNTVSGGNAATWGMTFATLAVLPAGVWMDGAKIFSWSIVPAGLLVGLLSSAIPYSLEMVALRKIPTQTFGIFMSLEPALASLVGFFLLKESLGLTQWLAIALVIVASMGSVTTAAHRKRRTVVVNV